MPLIAVIALLFLTACTGVRAAPTDLPSAVPSIMVTEVVATPTLLMPTDVVPTVTMPAPTREPGAALLGRVILQVNFDLYELPLDRTGDLTVDSLDRLLPNPGDWALSPDGRRLLYGRDDKGEVKIRLFDLTTRATTVISDDSPECLSWSTDGTRFSAVVDHELRVYDLSGEFVTLAQAPSARYTVIGVLFAPLGCGVWISPTQFVFQRWVGAMPSKTDGYLLVNASTLATLNTDWVLEDDMDEDWTVIDVCPTHSMVLLSNADRELFLAESITSLLDLAAKPLNTELASVDFRSYSKFAGFIGDTCQVFSRDPGQPNVIHIAEPATPLEITTYSFASSAHAVGWSGIWIGSPSELQMLVFESGASADRTVGLVVVDLITGQQTPIVRLLDVDRLEALTWLP